MCQKFSKRTRFKLIGVLRGARHSRSASVVGSTWPVSCSRKCSAHRCYIPAQSQTHGQVPNAGTHTCMAPWPSYNHNPLQCCFRLQLPRTCHGCSASQTDSYQSNSTAPVVSTRGASPGQHDKDALAQHDSSSNGSGQGSVRLRRARRSNEPKTEKAKGHHAGRRNAFHEVQERPLLVVTKPLPRVLIMHTGGTLGMDPQASYESGTKGVSLRRGTGGVYAGAPPSWAECVKRLCILVVHNFDWT
jgi:hypothetical protein